MPESKEQPLSPRERLAFGLGLTVFAALVRTTKISIVEEATDERP